MPKLVILRHGESAWNASNRFTGWVDVDLNEAGRDEARHAGELIGKVADLSFSSVHTSVLTRAIHTADIVVDMIGKAYLPVHRHWRLNERHYGALQGLNKKETADKFGAEVVHQWRRAFNDPPPAVELSDPNHPSHDPRYALVPRQALPCTESLATVLVRLLPYYEDAIAPELLGGRDVLVVAHGNSLRALMKHVEGISDEAIIDIELPTGVPRLYELDSQLVVESVRYLD